MRHQDDFFHRGVKTLQKLFEEIQESDLIVHLIGREAGWCIPSDQANAFLEQNPDFATRYPDLAQQGRRGELPATQWEAWLGLYLGRRVCGFHLDVAQKDPLQIAHLERLDRYEQHADRAADVDAVFDEVIGSLITLGIFSKEDIRRPIQLPFPTIGSLFKGREDFLERIRESLHVSADQRATAITGRAVHGLGGIGKTRLAVEYAWKHAEEYSAVLCVTADSPENLHRNLAELTGPLVLDLTEHAAADEQVRVAAALRWLQDHPRWFLILDNVDTEAAVEAVENLLSQLRGGHVLITSRLGRWCDAVEPLEIDVMATEDAASFLLEKTKPSGNRGRKPSDTDQADATALAKELGGLALALEQAGAYIVRMRKSFADYIRLWKAHETKVQQWSDRTIKYAGPTDAPLRSIAVTWQTTLDELGDQERFLMDLLAWFAPDPVPLSIFDPLMTNSPKLSTDLSMDQDAFTLALANLADFSLLRWDAEWETVTVHRVVQEILRTRQLQANERLNLSLNLLQAVVPGGNPADVRTWPEWEPLRSHVAFTTGLAKQFNIAQPTSFLMGELGALLSAKALHSEAERFKRDVLSLDEESFGADSVEVAVRLNNLAQTLQSTNRLSEAEPLMRRALTIDEDSYGPDHPNVAIRLNNLAQLLDSTNRLSEAEPLMRRALSIDEDSYGPDHTNVAIRLNNLASLLWSTNRLSEAEPLMRRALSIDEDSYGPDHPEVATVLNNLASLLKSTNRLSEPSL